MDHEQLADLIHREGAVFVAEVITGGLAKQIELGWDLVTWHAKKVPGAILFYRLRAGVITDEPRILVVHAPESDRPKWQPIADESDAPVTLLLGLRA